MPNYQGPQIMPWNGGQPQPQPVGSPQQFQTMYPSQPQNFQQQSYQAQPPVMSIAPVRGRENATQFPVAVGTDLYLIDMQEMKLYNKNNPANPREMEEFDISRVVIQENQNEFISRAEFDEMKGMMAQMMAIIQGSQQQEPQPQQTAPEPPRQNQRQPYNKKGGNRNA